MAVFRGSTVGVDRGRSSVGRAREWHSRGQGFDSPRLHFLYMAERSERGGGSSRDGPIRAGM